MIEASETNKESIIIWQCDQYREFHMAGYKIRIKLEQSDEALQLIRNQSYSAHWDVDDAQRLKYFPIINNDAFTIFLNIAQLYEECEIVLELVRKINIRKITIHTCGFFATDKIDELREYTEIAYKNIANISKTPVAYYVINGGGLKIIEPD